MCSIHRISTRDPRGLCYHDKRYREAYQSPALSWLLHAGNTLVGDLIRINKRKFRSTMQIAYVCT